MATSIVTLNVTFKPRIVLFEDLRMSNTCAIYPFMKETAAIGRVIKARRLAAGLTLDDLADVIDVQRPEMWRKEKGTSQFTVEQLAAIAKRLGTFPEVICKEARQGGDVDVDRAELDSILSDASPDSIKSLLTFLKSTTKAKKAR